ncbi:hypothetical protein SMA90_24950, partial [Escherichia coli]
MTINSNSYKRALRKVFNLQDRRVIQKDSDFSYDQCNAEPGTVAKLAMRQPFVLFKGLTFQKLCLPGAFRPGD